MKTRAVPRLLTALAAVCSPVIICAEEPLPETVSFNRDIRPILSDACFKCHGPDEAKREADLRLDLESSAKAKLGDRAAIAPGLPDLSELMRRITSDDADERMPPADTARQLTPRQISLLRRWIEQGANYEAHWSFIPPQRPPLPATKDSRWARNPVDNFILERLEREGLAPSQEAEKTSLIRRLSFDLTGLPPTPAEVDAYLADVTPQAYERVVDRLLASPRHGERMASRWLDAARYADTSGYQNDGDRHMWRWRDWVIDAFNHNMPFDQFTIEQLAGDLLPNATTAQRIATGFNRNHRGNAEGGIVPEEYAAEYVVDRVDTTSTVWLGLTMGCARCHDHKYDPITQREFYSMFAFFNNVPEHGRALKVGNSPPTLSAPTDAQRRKLAQLDRDVAAAEARMRELEPRIAELQAAWDFEARSKPQLEWTDRWGMQARFKLDGRLADSVDSKRFAKFEGGESTFVPGRAGPVAELDGHRFINCGDVGAFGYFDKFTLSAWIKPKGPDGAILSRMAETFEDSEFASDTDGYRVYYKNGRIQAHFTKRWADDAMRVETEATIAPNQWHHVAVVYGGTRFAADVKIYVNGEPQKTRVLLDLLNQTFLTKNPLRIGAGGGPEHRFQGAISDVRVYGRALNAEEVGIITMPESIQQLATIPVDQRGKHELAALRACFLDEHAPWEITKADAELYDIRTTRDRFIESLPTVMIMEEMPKPRETFVLLRGEYDKRGPRVMPGVPASLPPAPTNPSLNRLDFARWLADPANPLTARVAVNHYWQMIFGTGLVKTTEDFGSQGEPPSHAELLDWLATEFMRTGWDGKRLLKTLVMSASYRQSSRATPASFARDPENRLLARGPRIRLSAEMIRDQALAVSGLLVGELGGPSVKPYQPAGLLKALTGTDYVQDHGEKLWRRSLYTFWKRTSPQPTMMTFDAAGREACMVRPSRTDTPLQALALMNDVTFVEAARGLAQRILREGGATEEDRLRLAFRLVLARPPRAQELQVLRGGLHDHLARFRADAAAAQALISAGEAPRDAALDPVELAAYTALAGLILNLDETINKQ